MAMIKCKECGKEMSDKAKACPNCGARYEKEDTKILRILLCILIGIFIFTAFLMSTKETKNNTTTNKTTVIKTTNKIK